MDYKFSELKKAAKGYTADDGDYKLAVLGDNATQMLSVAITGMGNLNDMRINVFDADYDQIKLQVFDNNSELYDFNPDGVLIFMCTQKLFEEFCSYNGDKKEFAEEKIREIAKIHKKLYSESGACIIQFTFMNDNDCIFGNLGLKQKNSFIYQLYKLNMLLMELATESSYLYLADINNIRSNVGVEFIDRKMYCSSKLAVSLNGLPEMAYNVVTIIKSLKGIQKKCIICDLDNTLWGGIVGDDGIDNIEIGELGAGHAFTEFQMWLSELKNRGIILCICSKNDEDIAKEVFEKHPDMILRLEDIAVFIANWENKATNILRIKEILNIGMDSIVFIDDNPFERELVKKLIPEISVPEMPVDVSEYCSYLKSLNLFETSSFSDNDAKRTQQYKSEFKRNQLMTDTEDFDSYLKSLNITSEHGAFNKHYFSRIAQLTQRSNQFNLRTVRYSESDIERIASDDKYITLYFTLNDRFGEYGLVAVVILEKRESTLFVDTLLMSCRVLKRGMEEYIFNIMVDTAVKSGFNFIESEYIPTDKNKIVSNLYNRFGFDEIKKNFYMLNCDKYKHHKSFIKKNV